MIFLFISHFCSGLWHIRNVEYVFKAFVPNKINTKTYNNMAYRQICVYYMFACCIIFSRV